MLESLSFLHFCWESLKDANFGFIFPLFAYFFVISSYLCSRELKENRWRKRWRLDEKDWEISSQNHKSGDFDVGLVRADHDLQEGAQHSRLLLVGNGQIPNRRIYQNMQRVWWWWGWGLESMEISSVGYAIIWVWREHCKNMSFMGRKEIGDWGRKIKEADRSRCMAAWVTLSQNNLRILVILHRALLVSESKGNIPR